MPASAFAIRAGSTLLDGELVPGVTVVIRDGLVTDVGSQPTTDVPVVERADALLAPGFIDLHVHALDGHGVIGAETDVPGLGEALVRRGVTGFLATTIATPIDDLAVILRRMPQVDFVVGARFLGAHLEGPWLSPLRPGAQPRDALTVPSIDDLGRLVDAGPVVLVTIAPELPGATDLITAARGRGITVSVGHSDATYDQVVTAVQAGATHITHAFNAMSPLHHRDPGVAGAALDLDAVTVEAIGDGVHLHPATVRLLWRARGASRVCLVSDAVDVFGRAGAGDGTSNDAAVRRPDGVLAGSVIGLDTAFRNAVAWGIPVADALTMATAAPAAAIGRDDVGVIRVGAKADLVLLDDALHVDAVLVGGESVRERSS